jgi:hypothetical protein
VGITGEEQEQAYCKSAYKAMRFAFMLKKQTGFYIDDASLKALSEEIAKQKAEASAEQEAQPEAEEPKAEEPKKKQRKPRTKKVQQPAAESAELIAFV